MNHLKIASILLSSLFLNACGSVGKYCENSGVCRVTPEEVQPYASADVPNKVTVNIKRGTSVTVGVIVDRRGIPDNVPLSLGGIQPNTLNNGDPLLIYNDNGLIVRATEKQFTGNYTKITVEASQNAVEPVENLLFLGIHKTV